MRKPSLPFVSSRLRFSVLALLGTSALSCTSSDSGDLAPEPEAAFESNLPLVSAPNAPAFPSIVSIPLGVAFSPRGLEIGDFNGDGALDLLVSGSGMAGPEAAVYLGHGDGTFDPPTNAGLEGCSVFPVVGRVNDDDRTDVVTPGCASELLVQLGRPSGTLSTWDEGPEWTQNISNIVVADADSDDDADIITLSRHSTFFTLRAFIGAEGRGFWNMVATFFLEVDDIDPTQMAVGHLDNDGMIDVLLAERDRDVMRILGDRTMAFVLPVDLGVDIPPWSIDMADLDGDGLDEVVVASVSDTSLQILTPDGTGDLMFGAPVPLVGIVPFDTVLSDLDADGNIDIAMVDDSQSVVQWIAGDGLGGLGVAQDFGLPSPAIRVHAGDFDGDGTNDLVTATFDDGSVTLLLSTP